tara:strand:+ start:75 stop:326 length:252 start_codon:yes stop_codon:yes gene_type:complete
MGQVISVNFSTFKKNEEIKYEKKLIRIRDEIESYLELACLHEEDSLAVALAAGRFASMKLAQLTGEDETKSFLNDCINTTLKN